MLIWLVGSAWACTLTVSTPGECVAATQLASLEFCFPHFTGEICVPVGAEDNLPIQRDVELSGLYGSELGLRLHAELNGDLPQTFSRNSDCRSQYQKFLCLVNFPRCVGSNDTAPVCRSLCEKLVSDCDMPHTQCAGLSQDTQVCTAALALVLSVLFV